MIIVETVIINGTEYQRTYSDLGVKIEREGVRYDEAIDPMGIGREYTETDEPIEGEEASDIVAEKARAYDIIVGNEVIE